MNEPRVPSAFSPKGDLKVTRARPNIEAVADARSPQTRPLQGRTGGCVTFTMVLAVLLPLTVAVSTTVWAADRMDEPYGSRYLDYAQNKVWAPHYGDDTDRGWPTRLYPKFIEDVNGDDMADAVAFGKPGTFVSLSTGKSFQSPTRAIDEFATDQGWTVADNPRFVTDINRDGKKDLVGYGPDGVYAAKIGRAHV